MSVFFFQAEDGIRDWSVTGVQTCALPIFRSCRAPAAQPYPGQRDRQVRAESRPAPRSRAAYTPLQAAVSCRAKAAKRRASPPAGRRDIGPEQSAANCRTAQKAFAAQTGQL